MIKNKPEAYGISSDNLLCMVQELETFVEDIHSISVVCDNDVIFSKCIQPYTCLLYTSPSPRDISGSRMPSSA